MKKSLLVLSGVLTVALITSCKREDKYKITADQWNEAIENIVNVKKKKELNYIAYSEDLEAHYKGDREDTLKIKEIEVNDAAKAQRIQAIYKGFSLDPFDYLFYKVNDNVYFQVAEFIDKDYDYAFKQNNPTQLFNNLLDLYDNFDYFTYNEETHIYECLEEGLISSFDVKIGFENNKIHTLTLDYELSEKYFLGIEASLKGTLTFNYGVATVNQNKHKNEMNDRMHNFSSSGYTMELNKLKPVFLTIDNYSNPISQIVVQGKKSGEDFSNMPVFFDTDLNDTLVFADGELLTCGGATAGSGDYYYSDKSSEETRDQYKILRFNTDVSGKKIELCLNSLNAKSGHGELIDYPNGPYKVVLS